MTRHALYLPAVVLIALIALTLAACGGSGYDDPPAAPPPPPAPSFSYTFDGAAVKGIITGGTVSVRDAGGTSVGGTTQTGANGEYELMFTTDTELETPLQLVINGAAAQSVCDVEPICEVGTNSAGDTIAVGFGEVYDLPDDFELRAPLQSLDDAGDDSFTATAYVSPLSEFVTAAALAMGDGETLTGANLDVANEELGRLLGELFPTLPVPASLQVATIPLFDLTDLSSVDPAALDELSIAATVLSATVASFVEPGSSTRGDIVQVIADFSAQISANADTEAQLLNNTDDALLARASADAMGGLIEDLNAAVDSGALSLPDGLTIAGLTAILQQAETALPEIIDIWTTLSHDEEPAEVASAATGRADIVILPDTGEARLNLETTGIEATVAHIHRGFAGMDGPVLVGLERDPGNDDRWQLPADTVLDAAILAAILRGETYYNVHSEAFPGGEVRGQILPDNIELFIATPKGVEQVPEPVTSEGFAMAALTLDRDTNIAQVHFTSNSIELVAAHIHQGIAGTNGPIVIDMMPESENTAHWFADDAALTTELLGALDSADLYFNLHTAANPGGELRGQIVPDNYRLIVSRLDPSQVVSDTPVTSNASAVSAVTLQAASGNFSIHLNTTDIVDPSAAHIHDGAADENGPIIHELSRDDLDGRHWLLEDATFIDDELAKLFAGTLYAQVHTAAFPGGEIRGQLVDARLDSDGDGVPNVDDAFPNDPTETTDSDGDGVGDNADDCPNDPDGSVDADGDGVCEGGSEDADGDGVPDEDDAFPDDPDETQDTDGDGVGDNGDNCPNTANADQADSDGDGIGDACQADTAPEFSDVQSIFNSRCVTCHSGPNPPEGLSLEASVSHGNLVNVSSTQLPSLDRIEPNDPDNSYLVWKIEGRSGIAGGQMPLGGTPLTATQIQTIHDWINGGANP